MASLSLKNIYKVYPNGFEAVKDFNLEIKDQEFIIFVGPCSLMPRRVRPFSFAVFAMSVTVFVV